MLEYVTNSRIVRIVKEYQVVISHGNFIDFLR